MFVAGSQLHEARFPTAASISHEGSFHSLWCLGHAGLCVCPGFLSRLPLRGAMSETNEMVAGCGLRWWSPSPSLGFTALILIAPIPRWYRVVGCWGQVLFAWPEDWSKNNEKGERFVAMLRGAVNAKKAVMVLKGDKKLPTTLNPVRRACPARERSVRLGPGTVRSMWHVPSRLVFVSYARACRAPPRACGGVGGGRCGFVVPWVASGEVSCIPSPDGSRF